MPLHNATQTFFYYDNSFFFVLFLLQKLRIVLLKITTVQTLRAIFKPGEEKKIPIPVTVAKKEENCSKFLDCSKKEENNSKCLDCTEKERNYSKSLK